MVYGDIHTVGSVMYSIIHQIKVCWATLTLPLDWIRPRNSHALN